MPTNQERFKYLYDQYIHNTFSKEELEEFLAVLDKSGNKEILKRELEYLWKQRDDSAIPEKELLEKKILANILSHSYTPAAKVATLWNRPLIRTVAASLLVLMFAALAGYYVFKDKNPDAVGQSLVDVQPGKDGAVLTLSNGETIVLEDLEDGVVTNQKGASIVLNKHKLIYDAEGAANPGEISYNKISTRRGRQFGLILSDGTKVWLNSASSLKYPTVFKGKERSVEITGEAYFEVVKNAKMPFKVKINDQASVEVLGTSFNISAYTDENTNNTTLVEGKVKVFYSARSASEKSVILSPGQQARVQQSTVGQPSSLSPVQVSEADIDQVTAWKNGLFNFKEKKLKEVMKQLSRWYDIDVVYEEDVSDIEFWGETSRNLNLSEVLHLLKKSGVNFRIEQDRKLIVLK